MGNKERLYDAFGEMIYVVAMADGIIQENEIETLKNIIAYHPGAEQIKWSFNYERLKHEDLDYLYNKVLDFCYENGPDPEYKILIEVMEKVAAASSGIEKNEEDIINRFTYELTERFKRDLDKQESNGK